MVVLYVILGTVAVPVLAGLIVLLYLQFRDGLGWVVARPTSRHVTELAKAKLRHRRAGIPGMYLFAPMIKRRLIQVRSSARRRRQR